jgi:class 3 adenylate cyclase
MNQARRLAAILAADVAGYSRLMGADEEGTLERLNAGRIGGFEEGEFEAGGATKEVATQICLSRPDAVQLRAQKINEPAKIRIVVQRDPLGAKANRRICNDRHRLPSQPRYRSALPGRIARYPCRHSGHRLGRRRDRLLQGAGQEC